MSEDRSANVVLEADVSGYSQNVRMAAAETQGLSARLADLTAQMDRLAKSGGTKLQLFGAGSLASVAATTTAYAAFERQVSNLQSTAAVTGRSFDTMVKSINAARREFPVSTGEVAALVNQLSKVQDGTESVNNLTKTFIQLGAATGESTGALTTGLLQLGRQMGTSQRDVVRYANVLTELSQKSGTSAQGILEFSSTIAPIGRVAGMTQTQIMGVSNAFSQAGQDGYMAANAFNKMLSDIMQSVATGSPDMAKYANLIGVTVDHFQKMDKTKAIVQIFDELNRMGPQAITVLNRMGLDGMRTMRSITAMTQQTGGIGKAVAEATSAYGSGAGPNSSLARGSSAATDGIVDNLEKLKNTTLTMAEAVGKTFEPMANGLVKGMNAIAQAVASVVDGPLGKFVAMLGGIVGAGGLAAGTLLKLATPLASVAAGVALFRNFGVGGFMAGRKLAAGESVATMGGLAGYTARAQREGRINPIGNWMYQRGEAAGWRSASLVAPGAGSRGGLNWVRRAAGVPFHLAAGALRFGAYSLEPGMHPFDPSARATMLPIGQGGWRSSFAAMMGKESPLPVQRTDSLGRSYWMDPNTGRRVAAPSPALLRAREGMTGLRGVLAQSQFLSRRIPGLEYTPRPTNTPLLGRTDMRAWERLTSGTSAGLRNFGGAVGDVTKSLVKTSGALGAMATQSAWTLTKAGFSLGLNPNQVDSAGNLLRPRGFLGGAGRLAGATAGMIGAHPIMALLAGGMAVNAAMKANKEADTYQYSHGTSFIDVYAKAVGEATVATNNFATALKEAAGLGKPKDRKEAMTASQKEADYVTGSDYQYTNKAFEDINSDKAMLALTSQLLGGTTKGPGGKASKEMIDAVKMDVLKYFDGNRAKTDLFMKQAWKNRGNINLGGYLDDWADASGPWSAHWGFWDGDAKEKRQNYQDQLSMAMKSQRDIAIGMGGYPAGKELQRGQFSDFIAAARKQYQSGDMTGKREMGSLQSFIQEQFAGGKDIQWVGEGGFNRAAFAGSGVDLERSLGKGSDREAVLDLWKQLLDARKDDPFEPGTYRAVNTMLAGMGLNRKAVRTLLDNGGMPTGGLDLSSAKIDPSTGAVIGGTPKTSPLMPSVIVRGKAFTQDDLVQGTAIAWAKSGGMDRTFLSGPELMEQKVRDRTLMGNAFYDNKYIEKALKPGQSGNANTQINAINEMVAEMQKAKLSTSEMVGSLMQVQNALNDTSDPLYQLAQAAMTVVQQLGQIKMAFRGPGEQYSNSVSNYRAVVESTRDQYGNLMMGSEAKKQREEAKQQAVQDTLNAIGAVKSMYIQQREFNIAQEQARDDFAQQRQWGEDDYQKQRQRAEDEFYLSRGRAEDSFARQLKDSQFDYNRQRLWAEQDYQHQVELMAEQTAKSIYNIYDRLEVQQTWSAPGMLMNMSEQNREIRGQLKNLDKARAMGLSDTAIQQLGLTDGQNAQELERLVQELNPARVKRMNRLAQQRVKLSGDLATDESSKSWQEMQRQHELQMDRSEEQYQTMLGRMRRNFKISMSQQLADFNRMRGQQQDDHDQAMDRMVQQFEKQQKRAQDQMERSAEDMSMSIGEILTKATKTLSGELGRQVGLVRQGWRDLKNDILKTSAEVADAIERQWGAKISLDKKGNTHRTWGDPKNSAVTTPGVQKYAEGGVYPGYTPGKDIGQIEVSGGEAIMRPEWTRAVGPSEVHRQNKIARTEGVEGVKRYMGGYASGGVVDPDKRVVMDGETVSKITAAQVLLAEKLSKISMIISQGSWQQPTWYSGTSHTGAGVIDTVPATPEAQYWLRRVGFAAWGRNVPWGKTAGSGAHIHSVSRLDPGARGHSQLAAFAAGGDGLGGLDYGPNPPLLPGLLSQLGQFDGQALSAALTASEGSGYSYGGGYFVDPRKRKYPFEKKVDANPILHHFFGRRNLISRGLNRAVGQYMDRQGIPHDDIYGSGGIFSGAQDITVGERGPEMVLPLNERGADFIATLLGQYSGYGSDARRTNTHGMGVPVNSTYNYRIDKSTTFTGDVIVTGVENPRQLAEKARVEARRKKLTQGVGR